VLRALIGARLSFLVSGGTGSGKTTLLSALLGLVGPGERIVLAEDSAELRPDHPHVVRLETRPANQEGAGLVTLQDLVRQALRMRPDRLVVGEVRGAEVVHLLAALNTGHEGGCGTVHANAAADVPARLEALGTAAGLDRAALHSQLAAALSVVLHLARDRSGRRRIAEVRVLERDASGLVRTVPALRWGPRAFVAQQGWPRLRELLRADGEELVGGKELTGDGADAGGMELTGGGATASGMELTGGMAAAGGLGLTGGVAPGGGGLELVGGVGRADGVSGAVSTEGTW
jgi:pilus assembly protein CpaF